MDQQKAKVPPSETRVLFRPEGMAMTDRPTEERPCSIYEADLPELRQTAIPAARYLVERGMPAAEMRITADYWSILQENRIYFFVRKCYNNAKNMGGQKRWHVTR